MKTEPSVAEPIAHGAGSAAVGTNGNAPEATPSGIAREYHNLLSDLEDLIASTRSSVGNLGGAIAERARDSAAVADSYVRAQPWQAVGISAGLGILIGFVLGRARRDP